MFVKQKNHLHSKCRACGTVKALDSMHRSGIQLMKQLPKNMSEIDDSNTPNGQQQDSKNKSTLGQVEENKDEEKKKQEEDELP